MKPFNQKEIHAGLIVLLLLLFSAGCDLFDPANELPDNSENVLVTEKDFIKMEEDYSRISVTADSILLTQNPVDGWNKMLPAYKKLESIKDAWITNTSLFIEFDKGGLMGWYYPVNNSVSVSKKSGQISQTNITPDSGSLLKSATGTSNLVGNKKVLIINNFYDDEQFNVWNDIIADLTEDFRTNGFQVSLKKGDEASLNFFRNGLGGYGVIYNLGHGLYDGKTHWLQTGQNANAFITPPEFWTKIITDPDTYQEWRDNKISVIDVEEYHDKKPGHQGYLFVSENLINARYSNNDFPNSLIYLMNCLQFKENENMAKAFQSKGAGVVLGWTEVHDINSPLFPESAIVLFTSMLKNPVTLEAAYNSLPAEKRIQQDTKAELKYYPVTGGSIQLIENAPPSPPEIVSPVNNQASLPLQVTLSWKGTDPENDPLTFDIYFGTTNNPELVKSNQSGTTFISPALMVGTTYYWKIVSKDNHGNETSGNVWSFSTLKEQKIAGTCGQVPVMYTMGTTVTGKEAQGCNGDFSCYSDVYTQNGVRVSPWFGEGRVWFDYGPVGGGSVSVTFQWVDNAWYSDYKELQVYNWASNSWETISRWSSCDGKEHISTYSISLSSSRIGPGKQVRVGIWAASGAVIHLNSITVG